MQAVRSASIRSSTSFPGVQAPLTSSCVAHCLTFQRLASSTDEDTRSLSGRSDMDRRSPFDRFCGRECATPQRNAVVMQLIMEIPGNDTTPRRRPVIDGVCGASPEVVPRPGATDVPAARPPKDISLADAHTMLPRSRPRIGRPPRRTNSVAWPR